LYSSTCARYRTAATATAKATYSAAAPTAAGVNAATGATSRASSFCCSNSRSSTFGATGQEIFVHEESNAPREHFLLQSPARRPQRGAVVGVGDGPPEGGEMGGNFGVHKKEERYEVKKNE